MYRTLDSIHITKTLHELKDRIEKRFPSSGLSKVCSELIQLAREAEARIAATGKANIPLRLATFGILAFGVLMLVKVAAIVKIKSEDENLYGLLQGIDSGFNILLLMGAAIVFLMSLEARWKRHKVMDHLHELRSIVHVIDMHQLPKDPSSDRPATVAVPEAGAPQRVLSSFELMRYLDYCSEMLSLTAKVAALYAQSTRDSIVVDAASDIGQITTNLSGKIWQKITLVQSREDRVIPLPSMAAEHVSPGATAAITSKKTEPA